MSIKIKPASQSTFIVYLDMPLGDDSLALLQSFRIHLLETDPNTIKDVVMSYLSLLVEFDPLQSDPFFVKLLIKSTFKILPKNTSVKTNKIIELPVFYDVSVGIDLTRIAEHKGISIEQIVQLHQQTLYNVYAIGFAPGFAYLGEVDETIAMPRLATPRKKVAKGSVAIADRQTAIYPSQSPGGWNIIGRCPINLFEPNKTPSMPFNAGDKIKFIDISKQEFLSLGGEL